VNNLSYDATLPEVWQKVDLGLRAAGHEVGRSHSIDIYHWRIFYHVSAQGKRSELVEFKKPEIITVAKLVG
jgi:hypothetical protein